VTRALAGRVALASVEVIAAVSVALTRFQFVSTARTVTVFGTVQVGCSGTGAPPPAVRTELQLACPS